MAKSEAPAEHGPTRRSQAERKESTRRKMLDAALYCLAEYGYAGTRVSQVVERAGVSRGAWGHHFASMDAMYLEAARHLIHKVFDRVAHLVVELRDAEDPMRAILHGIWHEFFASEVHTIYLEFLVASRRHPELAEALTPLSADLERNVTALSEQFFEPLPGAVDSVRHMMMLTRWLLRGIALDAHALPDGAVDAALDTWQRLLATQMRARAD